MPDVTGSASSRSRRSTLPVVDAAGQWSGLVESWRTVAARHGFRLVKGTVERIASGHRCVDYLASGASWLDLAGELGETHGIRAATLTTWVDKGESRFSLETIGEAMPRPRPSGAAGWFAAALVAPLMRKLAPAEARPLALGAPEDLGELIARHLGELLAIAGKPVHFLALEDRFAQERIQAAAARQPWSS